MQPYPENKGIFDEQRLGKTPTVITYLKTTNQNAIIVTPKSLLYQWKTEYEEWYNQNIIVIDGPKENRIKLYKLINKNTSMLISYNTIREDEDYIEKLAKYFNVIVIDEAHRIRNLKKSRKQKPKEAVSLINISKKIKRRIALSGTPTSNQADDIYGILYFLYPDIFSSYYNFREYYFLNYDIRTSRETIRKCSGKFQVGKERELLEFLDLISIQRKRKDVMQWLPKYDIHKILLEPSNIQKEANYNLDNFYEYKDIICMNDLEVLLKQKQFAISPMILGIDDLGAKFNYIENYLEDYPDKHIIIVSTLVEPLKILHKRLTKSNKLLIGNTVAQDRDKIKLEFQSNKLDIILANITVVKEGFTLDTADTIIFLDSSYIYTDNIQCMDRLVPVSIDRVHDSTQEIILLLNKGSVDEYIYDMVYVKKASSTDIINNYKKYIKERK